MSSNNNIRPPQQPQQPQQPQKPLVEYVLKILVVGEVGVGKTSVLKRYAHSQAVGPYKPTIGVDFVMKVIQWDENTIVKLQLWDIAGQERFGGMTRVYYKEAVGAIVAFDVTRVQTFEGVAKWKTDIDSKVFLPQDDAPIPCVLIANKCDLTPTYLRPKDEMDQYCSNNGFIGWFETSAKENRNIDASIRFLVEGVMARNVRPIRHEPQPQQQDTLTLTDYHYSQMGNNANKKNGTTCCGGGAASN